MDPDPLAAVSPSPPAGEAGSTFRAWSRPRPGVSRWAVFVGILVVVLGLFGAVGGLAWADLRVRDWVESTAERRLLQQLPQADRVDVTLEGFPFTLGVLVGHRVSRVRVHIDAFHHRGWNLSDLVLDVEGIELDGAALLDDQRLVVTGIVVARLEGSIDAEELGEIVGRRLEIDDHAIWATRGSDRVELHAVIEGRWIVLHERGPQANPLYYPLPVPNDERCALRVEPAPGQLKVWCAVDGLPDPLRHALAFG